MQALRKLPRVDVVLALLLAAYAQLEIWHPAWALGVSNVTGTKAVLSVTALAMTLPVAVRRRFPLAAVVIVMVATAVQAVSTTPTEGLAGIIAGLLCVYSVAAYSDTTRASIGAAVAFAAIAAQANNAGDLAFGTLIFGGAWLAGATVRRRQLRTRELEAETARLAVERDTAVARERARLARELHDVVAHSVSTMVVQAQAGDSLLEAQPERAREAFASIERSGRQALIELRRLLGLLRDEGEGADTAPQPGLDQLDGLIEGVRAAGLDVELRVHGSDRRLPPGVDLAAYRIVQEALTNALKHASPKRAALGVRYGAQTVELEVTNGVNGERPGQGHGLVGIRERVGLYGGELEAGTQG
ncbi:MAG TPA: histidine kinase, partial [Gaiellaceae bacterium]|nr:histidine kinase [Gaiellaceae bacterium]